MQANRPINNYWIRATTLDGQGEALGVLHYEGFHTTNQEPKSSPTICTNKKPCTIYNCPSSDVPDKSTKCVASYQFKGTDRALALRNKVQEVDLEVFLDFAFPIGASINGYRFVNPKNHLYSSNPMDKPCTKKDCHGKGCYCTHYIGGHNFTITHYDILCYKGMKLNNFFYSSKTCISFKSVSSWYLTAVGWCPHKVRIVLNQATILDFQFGPDWLICNFWTTVFWIGNFN